MTDPTPLDEHTLEVAEQTILALIPRTKFASDARWIKKCAAQVAALRSAA